MFIFLDLGHLLSTCISLVLFLAGLRVCVQYRGLASRCYLMAVGFGVLSFAQLSGFLIPMIWELLFDVNLFPLFRLTFPAFQVAGWVLLIVGLTGTLGQMQQRIRMLSLRDQHLGLDDRTPAGGEIAIWKHSQENDRGPRD